MCEAKFTNMLCDKDCENLRILNYRRGKNEIVFDERSGWVLCEKHGQKCFPDHLHGSWQRCVGCVCSK